MSAPKDYRAAAAIRNAALKKKAAIIVADISPHLPHMLVCKDGAYLEDMEWCKDTLGLEGMLQAVWHTVHTPTYTNLETAAWALRKTSFDESPIGRNRTTAFFRNPEDAVMFRMYRL